jgi:pimeloyl-ACP methyl ester carboxylesterase
MTSITWEYRIGGPLDAPEAIALISSIYETTNSWYRIAKNLIETGYRVLIISIPAYQSVQGFVTGFDLLIAAKLISKIHLIGVGFGAFLALHISNFRNLTAEVVSLTIISSFMNSQIFPTTDGFLTKLTGRSDLIAELGIAKVPSNLTESVQFVSEDLKSIPSALIGFRIKLRGSAPPAPQPQLPRDRVLVIQPTDWTFTMDASVRPHKALNGCRYEKIEMGGNHPHLANPGEVLRLIKDHLQNWHEPLQPPEEENEEY